MLGVPLVILVCPIQKESAKQVWDPKSNETMIYTFSDGFTIRCQPARLFKIEDKNKKQKGKNSWAILEMLINHVCFKIYKSIT